jgi:hypothetical protein
VVAHGTDAVGGPEQEESSITKKIIRMGLAFRCDGLAVLHVLFHKYVSLKGRYRILTARRALFTVTAVHQAADPPSVLQ